MHTLKRWRRACSAIATISMLIFGGYCCASRPNAQSKPLLTVKQVAGVAINPPVYFPAGSVLQRRKLPSQDYRETEYFTYYVSSPLSWQGTYGFYQMVYKGATVRWRGKQKLAGGSYFYFFAVRTQGPDPHTPWCTFIIYPRGKENGSQVSIPDKYSSRPLIAYTIGLPAPIVQKQVEKLGVKTMPAPTQ